MPLLAGTDAGGATNVHVLPGFSLADELELLVGCGLTPADAGEHAKKAGVKRLVITHVPPWYDRVTQAEHARRTFSGPVEMATPHAVFDI